MPGDLALPVDDQAADHLQHVEAGAWEILLLQS